MKEILKKHFQENYKNYFILMFIFTVGLIIGICCVNNMETDSKKELNDYLTNITTQIKENKQIDYTNILKKSITTNLKFLAIIVFISFSMWGEIATIILIGYKGFGVGYSISSAIAIFGTGKGLLFAVSLICLSEIIFIPAIFYITVLSMKKYKTLMYEKEDNKWLIIKHYLIALLAVIIILILSSLIQTYLNNNLFLLFKQYY